MKREHRKAEIRAATIDGKPGVTLKVITPHVVDDYGSVWSPDIFDESLGKRMPTMCWAHNWEEPLGPAVGWRSGDDGSPEIDFVFSDFEAVPIAKRAHTQVNDGTIRDCSVGFTNTKRREPTDEELERWPGAREIITRADLDEVSLVLRGAVPGAKVLSARAGKVEIDAVVELARRVASGELSDAEAQAALKLLGEDGDEGAPPPPPEQEQGGDQGEQVDAETLDADLDAALESIGRSRPR